MKGSGIERERMKTSWALKMDVRYWLGWDGWHYCSYYLALLWLLKRAGKKKWDCQRGLKRKEKRGEKRKIYPELSLEGKERKKRFCLLLVQPPVVVGLEESSSCKLLLSKARSSKKEAWKPPSWLLHQDDEREKWGFGHYGDRNWKPQPFNFNANLFTQVLG